MVGEGGGGEGGWHWNIERLCANVLALMQAAYASADTTLPCAPGALSGGDRGRAAG